MKTYELDIDGRHYSVTVNGIRDGIASLSVNGEPMTAEITPSGRGGKARTEDVPVHDVPQVAEITSAAGRENGVGGLILSPLPGVIINVAVQEGQKVRRGEKIAVLEAMKMENDILAESDGIVKKLYISRGNSLLEGAKIALIERQ